jgi:glycosyltransferase involved in cell wall biosynthesis
MQQQGASMGLGARVSAVITSYDRPASLRRAVESALRQSIPVEVLVVDDCSSFDAAALLASYENVRLIGKTANRGVSHSRNLGAAEARGEFIAFLDDDDVWLPQKAERQLETIGGNVICLCGMRIQPGGRARVRAVTKVAAHALRMGNPICGGSGFFVRRELFDRIRFDETLRYGEDWDFLVGALQYGGIGHCPEALFEFKEDAATVGLSTQFKRLSWDEMAPMFAVGDKHRAFMGDHCYRRRLARMTLAHLPARPDRLTYVAHSVRVAGPVATALTLSEAAARRIGQIVQKSLRPARALPSAPGR